MSLYERVLVRLGMRKIAWRVLDPQGNVVSQGTMRPLRLDGNVKVRG